MKFKLITTIIAGLFVIFLSLFSLDSFSEGFSGAALLGFFIHLIPTFILIGLIILAWRWTLAGGIGFVLLSLIFTIFFNTYRHITSMLLISFPVLIIGILYLVEHFKK